MFWRKKIKNCKMILQNIFLVLFPPSEREKTTNAHVHMIRFITTMFSVTKSVCCVVHISLKGKFINHFHSNYIKFWFIQCFFFVFRSVLCRLINYSTVALLKRSEMMLSLRTTKRNERTNEQYGTTLHSSVQKQFCLCGERKFEIDARCTWLNAHLKTMPLLFYERKTTKPYIPIHNDHLVSFHNPHHVNGKWRKGEKKINKNWIWLHFAASI